MAQEKKYLLLKDYVTPEVKVFFADEKPKTIQAWSELLKVDVDLVAAWVKKKEWFEDVTSIRVVTIAIYEEDKPTDTWQMKTELENEAIKTVVKTNAERKAPSKL